MTASCRYWIRLPDIQTYIIYTGRSISKIFTSGELEQDEEGRYILSLSKEFFRGKKGSPELLVKVIYLKNGSGIIQEYIRFSQIFDEQMAKLKTEQDRTKAINITPGYAQNCLDAEWEDED